ncbi:hypothetical protein [Gimesia sp.]|uniref:hypothetical protein n=1 Tax=Gimesia sp. TaxID=2024833 RepID=UPI003A924BFE
MTKIQVSKSNGKPQKARVKTWADRQKAAGVRLELSQHKPRNHWKKMVDGKYHYFKHPITKAGYESALREWLNLKAEMDFEKPYLALIQHHIDIFKAVQNYFDHAVEQTTKEKKMAQQVDQFINWLEVAFDDPDQYIAEVDSSTSLTQDEIEEFEIVNPDISSEENNFRWAVMSALRGKSELADNIVRRYFGKDHIGTMTFQLPEEWKEKTEFTESPEKLPQTVGYWVEDYLKAKGNQALNGEIEISTFRDAKERLCKFSEWIGEKTPIEKVGSETLKKYHSYLSESKYANKSLYFQFFKTFVVYCVSEEACALEHLPNNITSRLFVFRSKNNKKIAFAKSKYEKLWTKADIQRVIAKDTKVPERYQCWILLMLNCAMTQSDLNDLKRDEIDLKEGRIIRIRKKAEKYPNPPVVNYKLWDITLKHLKKQMEACTDEEYALQSTRSARLISESISVDKDNNIVSTRSDNVCRWWDKNRKEIGFDGLQLKYVKKSGITALTENIKYMHLDQLYLGHSHRTLADRNYNSKGGRAYKPLDDAIAFIGKHFGLK